MLSITRVCQSDTFFGYVAECFISVYRASVWLCCSGVFMSHPGALCLCCFFCCRGATMSRDFSTLTWAVYNFVSAANLLMRELRSVGRNQFSVTDFRWLVLCLRYVIAALAGIDPNEPSLLSTSGDACRQLETDAYWAD